MDKNNTIPFEKKDFIRIITSKQFEIKSSYLANPTRKKIDYTINIYMFLPKSLNITSETYQSHDFYNDRISYTRLKVPKMELGVLIKQLNTLVEKFQKIESTQIERRALKSLICSYASYLQSFFKDLQEKGVNRKRTSVLLERIRKLDVVKKKMYALRTQNSNEKFVFLVESAAEYLSLTTQYYLLMINMYLTTFDDEHKNLINKISELVHEELLFCKKNNFPVVSSNEYNNEEVVFRYSVFKKFFYSVLNLYQERRDARARIKELYYSIAAGIAMFFTTVTVFLAQPKLGNFTMQFFIVLVVSYMLKDRIKEGYRHYFDKKMDVITYDFKEKIYDFEKQSFLGFVKERFRFTYKDKLDPQIVEARLKNTPGRLTTWYLGEDIIKYEKNITLFSKNIQEHYDHTISGIHNIMRFDVTKFLNKMDTTKIPLYDEEGNTYYGDKVYHVNIIVEFMSEDTRTLHKARLILCKKGIKRIELPEYNIKIFKENKLNFFAKLKNKSIKIA